MYHNIWGNILMYCESNNIKLGDLVVDIFHNTNNFVNDRDQKVLKYSG